MSRLFVYSRLRLTVVCMGCMVCLVSTEDLMAQTSGGSIQVKPDSAVNNKNSYAISKKQVQPKSIEEYLNQISNPDIPRDVRKKWKEEALQLFASKSVQVLAEKNGLGNRYTAAALLDLLVDFPHQIKTKEILRDQQDKITELHLELNRQTN